MQRRRARPAAVLLAVLLVAGCTGDDGEADEAEGGAVTTIGVLVAPGGGGEMTAAIERAESELDVVVEVLEPSADGSDRVELLTLLAGGAADLVLALGAGAQEDVEEVAADHPDLPFAILGGTEPTQPNVTAVRVREEQAAYLAGAVAALSSPAKRLGFVGGVADDATRAIEAGFAAGAARIDGNTRVDVAYLPPGAATDVAAATALAAAQVAGGVEVLLGAPAGIDDAVFAAAAQRVPPARAIGVGPDRTVDLDPALQPVVLTWAVTRTDVVLLDVIDAFLRDRLDPGVRLLGVDEGAVGVRAEGLPPDVVTQVEDLTARLVSREIQVPVTP